MRSVLRSLALLTALVPVYSAAADVPISCTYTHEMMVIYMPTIAPDGSMTQRTISEIANYTITPKALITSMAAPCNSISGNITDASIDVSCPYPADKNGQTSVTIKIDRHLGTVSRTFAMTSNNGSKSNTFQDGTCKKREAF